MKKTLLVTIDFPPSVGGVASYWNQVCTSLNKNLVVLTLPGQHKDQFGCKVIRRPLFYKFIWPRWLRGVFEIYKVYKAEGCSQILVGQILPVGSMAYLLYKVFNIPYIVQVYGMDLAKAQENARKHGMAKSILNSAQSVVANSQAIADIVSSYTKNNVKAEVVYPVPLKPSRIGNVEQLRDKYSLSGRKVVLTVGRLVQRKGQDNTLGAMMHVWQAHPEAVYVMVGDGPDRKRLEIMAAPHSSNVIFTGKVSSEEVFAWMSLADVFVMPSRQLPGDIEGFGMVYLEANHLGQPVIGGRSGGVVEAIVHGKTGLLVDPDDVDDIAEKILSLLNDSRYAKSLGENGRLRLEQDLTWEKNVTKLKKILT